MKKLWLCGALFISLSTLQGCSNWSWGSLTPAPGAPDQSALIKKTPDQVFLTEGDIVDKKYATLGDISVFVQKTTIFNSDPTPEDVNQALKERAAGMGADAVILVRYGTLGITPWGGWGRLEGNGRAVVYQ